MSEITETVAADISKIAIDVANKIKNTLPAIIESGNYDHLLKAGVVIDELLDTAADSIKHADHARDAEAALEFLGKHIEGDKKPWERG